MRKPEWLKVSFRSDELYTQTKKVVDKHHLNTICTSGKCPNIGECWRRGTATFMIGGEICTRSCKFCNTLTGRPLPLDPEEPMKIASSIKLMGLKHAVITSVDRDDLPDMGAQHWVETILMVKQENPSTTLEVLLPDFQGRTDLMDIVANAAPEVISHNIETVRRLTPVIRSSAKYDTSMAVLKHVASRGGIVVKSGLMVGLGETFDEVVETMNDLRAVDCTVVTIGQYLQPSRKNIPVAEYIHPDTFDQYREIAIDLGFKSVECGPLVRSSYFADKHLSL